MTRAARRVSRVFAFLCVVAFASLAAAPARAQSFVQVKSAVPVSATTVGVTYTNAQVAGDLNVVIVGWNDTTATLKSITDTKGNTYVLATGPVTISGSLTQSIYYAKNIVAAAAGTNTVSVTFSTAAIYPDIRILEYSGLDTNNPLDGGTGATGSATTTDSGAVSTTNATDLLVGANIVATSTAAPGVGFTQRIVTDPDGDIAEDRVVTSTGSYHATATLSAPGSWIMQVVAFKAAGAAPAPSAPGNLTATPISSSQINLSWTASTESGGTINNYLVERCQGAGCTNFAQVSTQPTTSFNDTGLAATTSYSYRVRATDTANHTGPYSNTASGTTLGTGIPTPTAPGNLIALSGITGPIVVAVQGYKNANAVTTHTTDPFDSTGGDVIVMCASSHAGVTMAPSDSFGNNWISIAGPTNTTIGDDLRTQVWYARNPTVGVGHTVTMTMSVAQSLVISVIVGKGSNVATLNDGVSTIGSDAGTTTVNVQSPNVTTTTSNDLLVGFAKTSTGEVFTPETAFTAQANASSNFLFAETGSAGAPGTYDATEIITSNATWQAVVVAISPSPTATNPNQVNLSWTASTETGGTVTNYLVERCVGAGCSTFSQIGTTANLVYTDTTVSPSTTYGYRVRAVDTANTTGPYSNIGTVTTPSSAGPTITSLSPTSGPVGTLVTITGTNFGSTLGTVSFNGVVVSSGIAWTPTSISVSVPTGATTGNIVVTEAGVASNGVPFTVTPAPVISSLSQTSGSVGAQISISGAGFGSAQGSSTVSFGGVPATATFWAQTSVNVTVPAGATTGNVVVTVGGLPSNGVSFTVTVISVSVNPATANVLTGTSASFTATVQNDVANQGVSWSLSGAGCSGSACGTIGSTTAPTVASYLAPSSVPSPPTVTVTATSIADPTKSATATITIIGPTAPTNLATTVILSTQISLSWTAATETGGTISNYFVERCQGAGCSSFTQIGTSAATSYSDSGLTSSTSYSYRVRATDSASNLGPYSATVSGTTAAPVLTAPTSLATTVVSSTQINLSWAAATETGGTISNYLIERCTGAACTSFTQIGTSTTTNYSDTALAASTSYGYRVRATDSANDLGPYSATASASTLAATPTAPTNLTATAASSTQVNLTWTASSETGGAISNYLVERCQGASCSSFAQIGTSTATSYSDTGLTGSTNYSYRVRATDLANSLGPYSATASATTAAPVLTAPTNLATTVISSTQINLSWTAATETGGTISSYLIERCAGAACTSFAQVGTSTTTSYSDIGLTGSTSYNYRVRAADSANDLGPYSATAFAMTAAPVLTAPTNLATTVISSTQINLSWTAATETGGTISSYLIERCAGAACTSFAQIGTPTTTNYSDTGLAGSTSYSYRIRAADAANNLGPYSATASASTLAATPTAPTNLTATAASSTQVNLTWTASSETGGTISSYLVERCQGAGCISFTQIGTFTATSYSDTGLTGSTSYSYRVRAMDSVGSTGPYSSTASATTSAPVITAPTNLAARAISAVEIDLTWTAATETGGTISSYLIERCAGVGCTSFAQIGTSTTTTLNDIGLTGATSYSYRVRAKDTAGNTGPYSVAVTAITAAPTITAPTNLTATTVSGSQINLSWTAATETGGTITSYLVERCQGVGCTSFAQVGTPTTTTFSNTGLTTSTSYSYRVRAKDTAGNTGPYSATASATTSSAGPPPIAFVQVNSAVPTSTATVAVTFTKAQVAGDLNVVIVGWNDTTATVKSVVDLNGNMYVLAAGPVTVPGALTQSVYYAKNIVAAAAGANKVTVTFSTSATYPDVRILEYSGLDANNPLDGGTGATGTATATDSGALTTTNANDLLLGANIVATSTASPGPGFTQRIETNPDGDIAEDRVVTAIGLYHATATLSAGGSWIMQVIAFKAAGAP